VPVAYDNLVRGHRWAVKWGPFVDGDIMDRMRLTATMREYAVRAVIHFAAYAYVGESMLMPGAYFENNVSGTISLLEAMRECGIEKIVFSSSCATYGIPEAVPIPESHPQRPINPYGDSKLIGERAVGWYGSAHGVRSVALRYFNAAGADPAAEIGEDHDPETHLIPLVIETAMGRRPSIEIFGTDYPTPDGTAVRDYIHVCDLADAHVCALNHLIDGGENLRLNLGTGRGHSVREVIAAVADHAGLPIRAVGRGRRAGDPPELVADASNAERMLNWRPRRSDLEQIVATAWRWHEKQRDDDARFVAAAAREHLASEARAHLTAASGSYRTIHESLARDRDTTSVR
jgi:UDP-arabinose 4-epimerase